MMSHRKVLLEHWEHYIKQTYRNRCVILSPQGPLALTLPVEKANPRTPICQLNVSEHGNWRHLHWQALTTAYESTPYFEHYAPYLLPFYQQPAGNLLQFNTKLTQTICQLLQIPCPLQPTLQYESLPTECDYRNRFSPKRTDLANGKCPQKYYQVFQQLYGFQPNLSIIDLLFNLGPESRIYLHAQ